MQESDIILYGHHTRARVKAIMDRNPVSLWIDESLLWTIKSVEVPDRNNNKSRDGLTDA